MAVLWGIHNDGPELGLVEYGIVHGGCPCASTSTSSLPNGGASFLKRLVVVDRDPEAG